jgi:hypothetical protein
VGGARSIEQLCSQFVSIADVAKRRAVLTTTGESPVTTAEGLTPPCESKTRSERAPEAGSSASCVAVIGTPRTKSNAYGEEHLSTEGAPDRESYSR